MNISIIIQARMNSSRLPGKVMKKINGIPIIELIYKRLKKLKVKKKIIVATSNHPTNKILIEFLKKKKINYYLGSEDDVLSRFYQTAKKYNSKIIVRITADCPLVDITIIKKFIDEFNNNDVEYLSNCNPWSYPDGLDVEIFNFNLLQRANRYASKAQKKNGGVLISYLKDNPDIKKKNISCNLKNVNQYRLTVDEEIDLKLIRSIYNHFYPNIYFNFTEILSFAKKNKKLFMVNNLIKQNEGSVLSKEQKLWRRSKSVILNGNSLFSKNPDLFLPNKWPTYFYKSKGYNIWDLSNNKFVDMSLMGVGTNTLGYNNSEVDNAVKKIIRLGNMSTLNCPDEVYLAEKLIDMHKWANKVKFARTGGEANAIAVRIARAASGRDNVAICGYHGWHDWYLASNIENKNNLNQHLLKGLDPIGVPKKLLNTTFSFQYGNYEELEKIVNNNKIGVIKMEVQRNQYPDLKFLNDVRKLADKKKIVLIFDECTSGFRETFGGLHIKLGVVPDMAILGKALGNGYAITAVLGSESVMDKASKSFISSTFWSERIGPTAGKKTLEIMEKTKSWERITYLGKKVQNIWKKISKRYQVKMSIQGLPALAKFNIESLNSVKYKAYITQEMLKKNFLAANSVYMSIAHDENILRRYEEYLEKIFKDISDCEKDKFDIDEKLEYPCPINHFERLN